MLPKANRNHDKTHYCGRFYLALMSYSKPLIREVRVGTLSRVDDECTDSLYVAASVCFLTQFKSELQGGDLESPDGQLSVWIWLKKTCLEGLEIQGFVYQ